MRELGMTHNCFTFLWRHLHLSTVDISAVESKEEIAKQEMRNSGMNNEKALSMEPVVVRRDLNDDEGADDDNDYLST
eukprot:3801323-Ditylum_brightwellii.AAC.1